RRRSEEALPARLVVEGLRHEARVVELRREGVLRRALADRGAERIADRAIPGAAAEIAAELIGELLGLRDLAVEALEHRHDEARRAEAALGAVVLDHGLLHGVRAAEALDGHELAARDHGHERDARVDRAEARPALRVTLDEVDRAGAAVALGAALLRAREAARAEPVGERRVR